MCKDQANSKTIDFYKKMHFAKRESKQTYRKVVSYNLEYHAHFTSTLNIH